MDYCKNCKRWTCGAQGTSHEMSIPCGNYIPPTNADRIRAMTDEELAEFLLKRDLDIVEKASKTFWFTYKVDREQCLVNVIDWLKEGATE